MSGAMVRNAEETPTQNSIVRYMRGRHRDRVHDYCKQRGWNVSVVHQHSNETPGREIPMITARRMA